MVATPNSADSRPDSDIDAEGWLAAAERRPSPNQDARPPETTIDLLVIHNISLPPGEFGGDWIDALFHNRLDPNAHPYFAPIADVRVSAHLLIRRDGRLIQYVPCERRAWHAGVSSFEGRERCNDYSIGIELEGADETPFTEAQYIRLAACTRRIRQRYPAIGLERIVGHSDIAPGRKTDPGPAFDWARYRRDLGESRRDCSADLTPSSATLFENASKT
ncbi:1,6-anhydro-N-acetylmuramyl-L-alanine amidase AmpD [Allochromatium tepidum]|uniref:1,6-anhydro-N-acetylmuramyl-L-alanine amidase AmpD n=1 Tax=Allochromatium tepidum TaxID=553982 RepID=A0ABN6GBZ7_9GAMM|nr:1,6-anhydro-N-acetylmuramyl-L-alanine amidase AmpD [Allochromatium tepidum]BCU07189.1 N-acetyl-anhydromuranmyl-L-alanine amidase [Allochromatium tepidum]